MPLSASAPRRHLHNRDIALRGYLRDDGLIDIEAHLTDTKAHPERHNDGTMREIGDPVHDMWLRMTITVEREIIACEAAMDSTPFFACPGAAPNFARLAGLRIEAGFIRKALERVGGSAGCTHLRELLQQVGTVAFQTLYSVGKMSDDPHQLQGRRPPLLNSCFAWDEAGPLVRERYPEWATTAEPARVA
jgi:hypothetical protein